MSPHKCPDADLHARLAAGEMAALTEVYDLHSPYVYGLAMKIIKSAAQAEAIVLDVFVAFWERPLAYDPAHCSMREWLLVRTMHEAATAVSSGRAAQRTESPGGRAVRRPR